MPCLRFIERVEFVVVVLEEVFDEVAGICSQRAVRICEGYEGLECPTSSLAGGSSVP